MKKGISFLVAFMLIFTLIIPTIANAEANDITVTIDGKVVAFDQPPIIEGGRTLVPMRMIFETMGATVEWNADTQTVTGIKGNIVITMQIGNTTMTKNGQEIVFDVSPLLINSRTLVPLRFVAEAFGANVSWYGDIKVACIYSSGQVPSYTTVYDASDWERQVQVDINLVSEYQEVGWITKEQINEIIIGGKRAELAQMYAQYLHSKSQSSNVKLFSDFQGIFSYPLKDSTYDRMNSNSAIFAGDSTFGRLIDDMFDRPSMLKHPYVSLWTAEKNQAMWAEIDAHCPAKYEGYLLKSLNDYWFDKSCDKFKEHFGTLDGYTFGDLIFYTLRSLD